MDVKKLESRPEEGSSTIKTNNGGGGGDGIHVSTGGEGAVMYEEETTHQLFLYKNAAKVGNKLQQRQMVVTDSNTIMNNPVCHLS